MARTTALTKIEAILYEPTFYKVIQGGMSAGKTFAIMTLLESYCGSFPGSLVTVVGMTYNHLRTGPIRDFKKIMEEGGRWDDGAWNKSEKIYYFPNGSQLEFLSVDNMTARGPRRDVLFVNEANGLSWEVFHHLAGRTRHFAIIDFNPSAKFWAHEELVEKKADETSFSILTYKDNEGLSRQEVKNIESNRPKLGEEPSNWWTVYGLGQIGSLEGNVYSGWAESNLEEITGTKSGEKGSSTANYRSKLVRYGLDFGFSNDETALVAVYELSGQYPDDATPVDSSASGQRPDKLGLVELIYQKELLGSQYPEALAKAGVDPNILIVADAARPEIIEEIRRAGYRIIGADKTPGSVLRGIDRVSQRQIVYCGEHLKREYLSYAWRKRRSGETLDEPQDGNDHLMDAIRYAVDDLATPPRFSF